MKKKMIVFALIALVVLCVGAYAATHMVALDKTGMVKPEETKDTVETVETVENVETAEITETADDSAKVEILELGGQITEIADGYILIMDSVHGVVQVNLGDDTLYDGADLEELSVGQYVQVMYDGKMTRSIPAQVTALRVYVHMIAGEVTQAEGGSVTIVKDETGEEIVIHLPEDAGMIAVGDHVTAATNGAMTMSLPPQVSAVQIAVDAQ